MDTVLLRLFERMSASDGRGNWWRNPSPGRLETGWFARCERGAFPPGRPRRDTVCVNAGVAIELETDHRAVDPARRDFDAWIAYTGETAAPRPTSAAAETPSSRKPPTRSNSSPFAAPGRSQHAANPRAPPSCTSGRCSTTSAGTPTGPTGPPNRTRPQNQAAPDLTHASGFRLYSILVDAAIGRTALIARDSSTAPSSRPPPPNRRPRALLPDHHRSLPPETRSPSTPPMDPPTNQNHQPPPDKAAIRPHATIQ